jgi:NAD(P)-dependent dehydrogenase (short-subunit alcohol dehydrogenase family)
MSAPEEGAPRPSPGPEGGMDRTLPEPAGRRLTGKVALVTGGGSGIGRTIALRFAREGACVVVAGRRSEPLQEAVREIRRLGGTGTFTRGDVGRADRAEMIVQAATYNFGGLDVLVNGAGVFAAGTVTETDERRWDRLMGTNLKGPFLLARCAVPAMKARGGGSIINVAAVHGMAAWRNAAAFSASKGGLIALTRSMAADLAPDGIRVNAICPGPMGAPEGAEGGGAPAPREDPPLGRRGRPEDVVGLALYLASDESSWVTGGVFPVDGGLRAATDV